ncbi:MAG: tetratricopeptide repeat protein [bacterium]
MANCNLRCWADALLSNELPADPRLLDVIRPHLADPARARRVITDLGRSDSSFSLLDLLSQLLTAQFDQLVVPAMDAARDIPHQLPRRLAVAYAAQVPDENRDKRIDIHLEGEDLVSPLAELAVLVSHRRFESARTSADPTQVAHLLSTFGVRLEKLGQYEEAVTATEESVATCRELVADRPDVYRPVLAGALTNLGNWRGQLGRYEEGLTAAEESVAIRRELVADRPDVHRPDLALALNNLGSHLNEVGRYEEALTAVAEAAKL